MHQQDVQAVVNALWAGGAEAVPADGPAGDLDQCGAVRRQLADPPGAGLLPALPGDGGRQRVDDARALDESPQVDVYQEYVRALGLGWWVVRHSSVTVPAYTGSLELRYARIPQPDGATTSGRPSTSAGRGRPATPAATMRRSDPTSPQGEDPPVTTRILVVDNYDSFVYTIVGYLVQLGATCDVRRNDAVTTADSEDFDGVLLSPGPGTPSEAGICPDMVRHCADRARPMLGVCLGHQVLGEVFGATVTHAPELMHGKTSLVHHDGAGSWRASGRRSPPPGTTPSPWSPVPCPPTSTSPRPPTAASSWLSSTRRCRCSASSSTPSPC